MTLIFFPSFQKTVQSMIEKTQDGINIKVNT